MSTKPLSDAAARLKIALSPPRMTQAKLAKRLGVSQQAVWGWLCGRSRPAPEKMAAIEELLGIPMAAWVTAPDADDTGEHPPVVLTKAG